MMLHRFYQQIRECSDSEKQEHTYYVTLHVFVGCGCIDFISRIENAVILQNKNTHTILLTKESNIE